MTRSTFTSETHAVILALDSALTLAITLHEIAAGPLQPAAAMRMLDVGGETATRESQGLLYQVVVATDAMSLVAALSANRVKPPVEKSMLTHLLWIRQHIEHANVIMYWEDTRDMNADGLTKGSVCRSALRGLADGKRSIEHAPRLLRIHTSGNDETEGQNGQS